MEAGWYYWIYTDQFMLTINWAMWARERCRTSTLCLLADCHMRQRLGLVFVVSVFNLSAVLYFPACINVNGCVGKTFQLVEEMGLQSSPELLRDVQTATWKLCRPKLVLVQPAISTTRLQMSLKQAGPVPWTQSGCLHWGTVSQWRTLQRTRVMWSNLPALTTRRVVELRSTCIRCSYYVMLRWAALGFSSRKIKTVKFLAVMNTCFNGTR